MAIAPLIGAAALRDRLGQPGCVVVDCRFSLQEDVPPWLDELILRCLRLDPSERPQSCWEILRDLERGEKAPGSVRDRLDPVGISVVDEEL